jgi:DNA-directed RNA polymerase subunit RPC12/RpoP
MAKIVIGCLLTAIAILIGVAIGQLFAFLLAGFILVIFEDKPPAEWDSLFHAAFQVAPTMFSLLAVGIAWYALLRKPKELKYASDPGACLTCGYDLAENVSGSCPECGNRIEPKQRAYLKRWKTKRA